KRLERVTAATARVAALWGKNALPMTAAGQAELASLVLQLEDATRAMFEAAALDGADFGFGLDSDDPFPLWQKRRYRPDGTRISAEEHFETYWRAPCEAGLVTTADIAGRDPHFYSAIKQAVHRAGKKMSDLYAKPARSHASVVQKASDLGRRRRK